MDLKMLRCPGCGMVFGVDHQAIGDNELVTCPTCDSEVDVEEDEVVVR